VLVDGRNARIPGYEQGNFVRPTILQDVHPQAPLPPPKSSARSSA
jgi:malonate-semialdehyde dehydrogenase (acetylating) / methylmalonate-semialdehyde dehydrogenase